MVAIPTTTETSERSSTISLNLLWYSLTVFVMLVIYLVGAWAKSTSDIARETTTRVINIEKQEAAREVVLGNILEQLKKIESKIDRWE